MRIEKALKTFRSFRSRSARICAAVGGLALLACWTAHGAAVLWNEPAPIAEDTDVSTAGTGVFAYCYYASTPAALNGVSFTAEAAGAITWDSGVTPSANTVPDFAGATTLSAAYKNVLYGAKYNSPVALITLTLNNLNRPEWLDDTEADGWVFEPGYGEVTTGSGSFPTTYFGKLSAPISPVCVVLTADAPHQLKVRKPIGLNNACNCAALRRGDHLHLCLQLRVQRVFADDQRHDNRLEHHLCRFEGGARLLQNRAVLRRHRICRRHPTRHASVVQKGLMDGRYQWQRRQRYAQPDHQSVAWRRRLSPAAIWCNSAIRRPAPARFPQRGVSCQQRKRFLIHEVFMTGKHVFHLKGLPAGGRPKVAQNGSLVLGFINMGEACHERIPWAKFGLSSEPRAMRDLWAKHDLVAADHVLVSLPAHASLLLRRMPHRLNRRASKQIPISSVTRLVAKDYDL